MFKINYKNLIRQVLPPLKRTPVRLSMLECLIRPLIELYDDFVWWRTYQRLLINVNGRVKVLEGFLRFKYGTTEISVVTTVDYLQGIGLYAEGGTMLMDMGMEDDAESTHVLFPLLKEMEDDQFMFDFLVYTPAYVDVNEVIADIEQYKTINSTYKLISDFYVVDHLGRRMINANGQDIIVTKQTGYI